MTNLDPLKQLDMPPTQIHITKPRRSSIKQYIIALLGFAKSLANTVSAWMQTYSSIFHSGLLVEVLFKFDLPGVWDGVWLIKNLRLRMHYYVIKHISKLILWELRLGNLDHHLSNKISVDWYFLAKRTLKQDTCSQNNSIRL